MTDCYFVPTSQRLGGAAILSPNVFVEDWRDSGQHIIREDRAIPSAPSTQLDWGQLAQWRQHEWRGAVCESLSRQVVLVSEQPTDAAKWQGEYCEYRRNKQSGRRSATAVVSEDAANVQSQCTYRFHLGSIIGSCPTPLLDHHCHRSIRLRWYRCLDRSTTRLCSWGTA